MKNGEIKNKISAGNRIPGESRDTKVSCYSPSHRESNNLQKNQPPEIIKLVEDIRENFNDTPDNDTESILSPDEHSGVRTVFESGVYEKGSHEKKETKPRRTVLAVGDLDADFNALVRIMDAAGFIDLDLNADRSKNDIRLKDKGIDGVVVQTGDLFDRGYNLYLLLDFIFALREAGMDFRTIAGNHEIMALYALSCPSVKNNDPAFYRMAEKLVDIYAAGRVPDVLKTAETIIEEELEKGPCTARSRLDFLNFAGWYGAGGKNFLLETAKKHMPAGAPHTSPTAGAPHTSPTPGAPHTSAAPASNSAPQNPDTPSPPTLRDLLKKGHEILFENEAYIQTLQQLKIMERVDDVLYIHAGIDDHWADILEKKGIEGINEDFKHDLASEKLGKYVLGPERELFWRRKSALTPRAATVLKNMGINAVVRGHDIIRTGMPCALGEHGLSVINVDVGIKNGNLGAAVITASGDIVGFKGLDYKNRKVIGRLPAQKPAAQQPQHPSETDTEQSDAA